MHRLALLSCWGTALDLFLVWKLCVPDFCYVSNGQESRYLWISKILVGFDLTPMWRTTGRNRENSPDAVETSLTQDGCLCMSIHTRIAFHTWRRKLTTTMTCIMNGTLRSNIIRLRTQDISRPRFLYTFYCQRTFLLIPGRVSDRELWGHHDSLSSSPPLFRVAFKRTLAS
ncbi:hypothetical protein HYPSUDRAFT_65980 [Hypholoma sublateritium FD-334 SS-4]|uniref:Secreted protein n=1 Tax=Hypholoma sublateritium (strain FD-334 SS-4) TaxID=945553 RepID=A0A0D2P5C4_HYPSF|nr:hypothetical protein HYPSUDRAFT_65980 [Hypholoma sublateritium FD-334 SS-4]